MQSGQWTFTACTCLRVQYHKASPCADVFHCLQWYPVAVEAALDPAVPHKVGERAPAHTVLHHCGAEHPGSAC